MPLVRVSLDKPESDVISSAAESLSSGGVLVAPTETQYGLLARADNRAAVDKVFRIKGRPHGMPVAVFVKDLDAARSIVNFDKDAEILAARFLPGPMTLVLPARATLMDSLVKDGKVGLRVSSCPVIRQLLLAVGHPLTATSANLSGQPAPVDISGIADSFGDSVDWYLDGGPLTGPPSTVVSTTPVVVHREGAVSKDEVLSALGRKET